MIKRRRQDRANGEDFHCTRKMNCSIASGEGQFCYVVLISARALFKPVRKQGKDTVESRFLEPRRKTKIGSRNR